MIDEQVDRSTCIAMKHGDRTAYSNYGCRCPDATAAHTAGCAAYSARRREEGGRPTGRLAVPNLKSDGRRLTDFAAHPICHQIRTLRIERGWSLPELAARTGVAPMVIASYERGDRRPTADRLDTLLAAFGMRLAAVPVEVEVEEEAP